MVTLNRLPLSETVTELGTALAVSLVVPVRNEARGLREFIESLLQQTLAPTEIIIVDGGSQDQTKAIVREYLQAGYAIRLIEDTDALPGRARNLGIEQAQTDWVALIDAGTRPAPEWLSRLVAGAQDETVDVVLGTYEPRLTSFFKECLALTFIAVPSRIDGQLIRGPSTASMMLRRTVWESLGRFPENLRACEDLLFFDRLNASDFVIKAAPEAVVDWDIPGNLSGVFRRFRTYSRHTLRAGLRHRWHSAVGRMYLGAAGVLALAVLHHWGWLLLILVGFALRVHRTIRARRSSLSLKQWVGPHTYAVVGFILWWIDLAALVGLLEHFFAREKPAPGQVMKPTGDEGQ